MKRTHTPLPMQNSLTDSTLKRVPSDVPFFTACGGLCGFYLLLIVSMLIAAGTHTTLEQIWQSLARREVQYSIQLSLLSCSLSTIFSLWVAVPTGYLLARRWLPARRLLEALLDIPIVLPPLVIGLCLLILFQTSVGKTVEGAFGLLTQVAFGTSSGFTYEIPAVVLAQFVVACAFAVRTMRVTFDQIEPRAEQVALTLGCNRSQAFWNVALPQAKRGLLAAGTLAFARSLGEFGPILVFAGATRMKTEVLPTTVFLELTVGNIQGAVAASLVMVALGLIVLLTARFVGLTGVHSYAA